MAFSFFRSLTVTSSSTLLPATQTNFPALVKISHATLKTVANGGHVNNTVTAASGPAVTMPADLIFTSDSGGTTKIPWEIESYDAVNGIVWAWILISSCALSTVIYCFYGDISVVTAQNTGSFTPASVWDSNFKGIWHQAILGADSTINANTGTLVNTPTTTTGQVNGAGSFIAASSQHIAGTLATAGSLPATLSGLIKLTSLGSFSAILSVDANDNTGFRLATDNANNFQFLLGNIAAYTFNTLGTIANGTTYYYAVTISGNNGSAIAYLAALGGAIATQTIAIGTPAGAMGKFHIGAKGTPSDYWTGILDELRYSNIARSANWITAEYNNQNDPTTFIVVGAEANVSSGKISISRDLDGLGGMGQMRLNRI